MESKDLGTSPKAINTEQQNQQSIQEQTPSKPPIKINWKLFEIAGFVVIILTVGGILLLKTIQPAAPVTQTPSPPVLSPEPETSDTPDFTLSEVEGWQTYRNDEFGFEVKYPEDWRAHLNSFIGEPSLILCPPEFFSEKNEIWIFWSSNDIGCAASPRKWFQGDGTVLVEGLGTVTEEDYKRIWEQRIVESNPIFTVYL